MIFLTTVDFPDPVPPAIPMIMRCLFFVCLLIILAPSWPIAPILRAHRVSGRATIVLSCP